MGNPKNRVKLSIIVIFYNMRREANRTLFTLREQYQQGVSASDYEVIVVDNGSSEPLDRVLVEAQGANFEYHYHRTDSVSPAAAVNFGVKRARGNQIACIVDGARMVSPSLVYYTLRTICRKPSAFIIALSWHLGYKEQNLAMLEGYNQLEEDRLLATVDWEHNGYSLFEISSLAPSSNVGFFGGIPQECSFFAMNKSAFLNIGGFDVRFQTPGGGLVNHDFLQRVVASDSFNLTVLVGEGVFHQFHGGVATNVTPEQHPWNLFSAEYEEIHGKAFSELSQPPSHTICFEGSMPTSARQFIRRVDV